MHKKYRPYPSSIFPKRAKQIITLISYLAITLMNGSMMPLLDPYQSLLMMHNPPFCLLSVSF